MMIETESHTYYRWNHGGATPSGWDESETTADTAEEAFANGEAYAESHKARWGYRHKITVEKVVVYDVTRVEQEASPTSR